MGIALADRQLGRPAVTACFFGDGAVAEGTFHESMNLAALWKLPVLFLCENNLYAMGTALVRHQAQPDLCKKAASYGMPAEVVDGPKRGFSVPMAQWLRGPLAGEMTTAVEKTAAETGILDPDALGRAWQEHRSGRANHEEILWATLVFCRWAEANPRG